MARDPHEVLGIPLARRDAERFADAVIEAAEVSREVLIEEASRPSPGQGGVSADVLAAVALRLMAIEGQ